MIKLTGDQQRCDSGLIILYMLCLSWVTVCFALPGCNRIQSNDSSRGKSHKADVLKFLSVLQSYCVAAFAFALLITAKTFGASSECNYRAVVVILRPFPALGAGRVVLFIVVVTICCVYTSFTVRDYWYLLRIRCLVDVQKSDSQPHVLSDISKDTEKNLQNLSQKPIPPTDLGIANHRVPSSNSCSTNDT